jgi:hypothetical protein
MATPPLRTEIAGTPTNAEAKAGFGKLWDYVTGLLGATGDAAQAQAAIFPSVTAGKVLGRDTSGNGVVQELPINVNTSGCVGLGSSAISSIKFRSQGLGTSSSTFSGYFTNASPILVLAARDDGAILTGQSTSGLAACPYNNTTASAANLVVGTGGDLQRSTSALKYKTDIRDLEDFDISKFKPIRYKSKSENDDQTKDHFGFIADWELESGHSELVNLSDDGEPEGFQYERMTAVLTKVAQKQEKIIDSLLKRIEALEAK